MGDALPGTADPLAPDRSPWHLLGAVIRHYRAEVRNRTIRTLAGQIFIDYSLLSKWERGERRLPADAAARLEEALDAGGVIPALQALAEEIEKQAASRQASLLAAHADDMEAERRRLLRLAALGALTTTAAGEALRQLIDASPAIAATHTIDDWEMTCADHMHALINRPAAQVRDDLLLDLITVQRFIVDGSTGLPFTDLHRIAARLAAMQANVLTRLGELGTARRWWITARKAADSSGDRSLRAWVRGKEAVFGLYGSHATETTIRLARDAQEIAGDSLTVGRLVALSAEAQGLAVLGDHKAARQRLAHLHDLTGRVGRSDPYGWGDDSAWFVASWVHTYAGAANQATDAREQAMAAAPCFQNFANLRLHEAIGLVQEGGHDEGLRLATETINNLAPAYRTHMIMATARRVLAALPRDHRPTPALTTYQAILNTN